MIKHTKEISWLSSLSLLFTFVSSQVLNLFRFWISFLIIQHVLISQSILCCSLVLCSEFLAGLLISLCTSSSDGPMAHGRRGGLYSTPWSVPLDAQKPFRYPQQIWCLLSNTSGGGFQSWVIWWVKSYKGTGVEHLRWIWLINRPEHQLTERLRSDFSPLSIILLTGL